MIKRQIFLRRLSRDKLQLRILEVCPVAGKPVPELAMRRENPVSTGNLAFAILFKLLCDSLAPCFPIQPACDAGRRITTAVASGVVSVQMVRKSFRAIHLSSFSVQPLEASQLVILSLA